jgi:hypothetical protein
MRKTDPIMTADGMPIEEMNEDYLCAKLHLVDLAGSERAKRTGSDGLRFKEGMLASCLSKLLSYIFSFFFLENARELRFIILRRKYGTRTQTPTHTLYTHQTN